MSWNCKQRANFWSRTTMTTTILFCFSAREQSFSSHQQRRSHASTFASSIPTSTTASDFSPSAGNFFYFTKKKNSDFNVVYWFHEKNSHTFDFTKNYIHSFYFFPAKSNTRSTWSQSKNSPISHTHIQFTIKMQSLYVTYGRIDSTRSCLRNLWFRLSFTLSG